MKKAILFFILTIIFSSSNVISAQEIGANFNHDPEIINFKYLKKTPVEWIRTTPYIFEYITGKKDTATSAGLQNIIEAKKMGYKIAFGFRWDFKDNNWDIPQPGSAEEKKCFETARAILERVGASVDIFKLGNEPNFETKPADMQPDATGVIPLVRFTDRLLTEVVEPFYKSHPNLKRPDVYVGSIAAPFRPIWQENPAVIGLLKLVENNPQIQGLAIHLHIAKLENINESFKFVRSIVKKKPIIVPEFSLNQIYVAHMPDVLGDTPEGIAFTKKYNLEPKLKLFEYFSMVNKNKIEASQWREFFATRKWFPSDALKIFYKSFKENNVRLATYGFLSQAAPTNLNEKSHGWFINPIFPFKTVKSEANGDWTQSPLWFKDFVEIVNEGKKNTQK